MNWVAVGIGVAVVLIVVIVTTGYVKASPDIAFIITGFRKNVRYVIGRSAVMIPFLEKKDYLILKLVQVDIRTESAVPTQEFINVRVDGVANVKIDKQSDLIERAAENFLNKDDKYIAAIAQQVLEGNMREIIGQMKLTELVHNRDVFAQKVQESTEDELGRMGLIVVNLTIQNFVDDNQVIENLGIDNITKIKKEAAIAKAQSTRDIAIAQSESDKEANDARITAETEIEQKNTDLEIKKSQLKDIAERERARADIAYQIATEQSRKALEIERENAEIAKAEKQSERLDKEIEIQERKLSAEVGKVAEADRYREQQIADAKAYAIEKEAEAMAKKAIAVRELGLAEADVMRQKAEAQNVLNQQALATRVIDLLPEMIGSLSAPLNNVDTITMYGEGNVSQFMGDQVKSMESVFSGVKQATGLDLAEIMQGKIIAEATGDAIGKGLHSEIVNHDEVKVEE
ncbi:flotillin family protein [Erysipelothrix sp. HDW6C]|uniref:flotillin family protein n=1 Tax=Erysipelothrix sp. HDW6C TaxID=2714930 RepID=UPI00140BB262|nr:flotillin family protein [Erysipelothrix sp. HDW6C]QIK69465.1 flotillin family protein [Erysipelothrix sp. HDW6C]